MHTRIIVSAFLILLLVLSYNVSGTVAFADVQNPKDTIFITDCSSTGACFSPCQITILQGDTVTWVNSDSLIHMVASGSSQSGPDGWFASSIISPHGTYSHKFDRTGPFTFFDNLHPSSSGVVIVGKTLNSAQTRLQQSFFSDWCSR